MPEKPDSLIVFTDQEVGPDGRPIFTRSGAGGALKTVEIPMKELQVNVERFLHGTQLLLERGAQTVGAFSMDEVVVQAQIGANGKVGFMGTGVGLKGEASITFTFKRVS